MPVRRHLRLRADARGFGLIQVVTVLVVLGILSATAVSGYAGMRTRATDATARLDLARAMEASSRYNTGHGGFAGLTLTQLRAIDRGLPSTGLAVVFARATTVCISSTIGRRTWYRVYPGGSFTQTRCR